MLNLSRCKWHKKHDSKTHFSELMGTDKKYTQFALLHYTLSRMNHKKGIDYWISIFLSHKKGSLKSLSHCKWHKKHRSKSHRSGPVEIGKRCMMS